MNIKEYLEKARQILECEPPRMDRQKLSVFVEGFLDQRERYLAIAREYGSPLYLFDEEALIKRAQQFKDAFRAAMPGSKFFYALKSNDHSFLIKTVLSHGYGADVSSGKELAQAVGQGAKDIIFSGPGKTDEELELACAYPGEVIVLIDSFGELRRLQVIALKKNVCMRAGVRLMVDESGLWRKFGIPLASLSSFLKEASACERIDCCGLQFHSSWNHDAGRQVSFLAQIGQALSELDRDMRRKINFVDIGGGYWPDYGEWIQPSATPAGRLRQAIQPVSAVAAEHYCLPALTINDFAAQLAAALKEYVFPHLDCVLHLEPGRWISHDAMHIVLTVIDKKSPDVAVADGGGNIIGWERFESDYFPVINLSRPALDEHSCMVFGSLCTPHDIWGYSYFGSGIEPGDVLLIPTQGAYTYSLRQQFIKALPKEVVFNSKDSYLV